MRLKYRFAPINPTSDFEMHPVLKAALDNPRLPGAYGSDPSDIGYNNDQSSAIGVDAFIRMQLTRWDGKASNDNFKR